ncbi:MAG: hypothetical protein Q8R20_00905 [Nanoarchaeota archaeon]|nr:hypothetical protein [Nanoarchaeota archaeon]
MARLFRWCFGFVLFFGFSGCGHETKPALILDLVPRTYPGWLYRPESVWTEIEDGHAVLYVRSWEAILSPDDPEQIPVALEKATFLAQKAAISFAISEFHLQTFDMEFDEPVTIITSAYISVFVRMRIHLDSAKRAPPSPKHPTSRTASLLPCVSFCTILFLSVFCLACVQ